MAEAEAANKVPDEIYDGAQESYGFEDEDEDEDEDDDVAEAIVAAEEHETEMSEPAAPGLAGADAASNEVCTACFIRCDACRPVRMSTAPVNELLGLLSILRDGTKHHLRLIC